MTTQMRKFDSTGTWNKRLHHYLNRNSILLDQKLSRHKTYEKYEKKSDLIDGYGKRVAAGFTSHIQRNGSHKFELSKRIRACRTKMRSALQLLLSV